MKVKARLSSVVSLRRPSKVNSVTSSTPDLVIRTSRENSLSGLPEEILLDILVFLRNDSDQTTFASCLLCCRRWHRICQPLLYRDVLLMSGSRQPESNDEYARKDRVRLGHRVSTFTTTVQSQQRIVRSLTIRTASCNIDWPKWRPLRMLDRRKSERKHWYTALCRTLPLLLNLTTFSLKIGDNGARVFWTPQGKVTEILDALPATVVNLEVDTMGADFATAGPSASPSHICGSLSRLLPRLKSLRTRLRFLCEGLFDVLDERNGDDAVEEQTCVTSSLRSAVVVFTPRLGTIGSQSSLLQTRLCGTFERPQHGEVFDQISRRCKDLCAAGKFPQLQHFKLIDRTSDDIDGIGYEVYDPVADETKNITWSTTAGMRDSDERDFVQDGYLPPGWHVGEKYSVTLADIAEGKGSWRDTSWRSRQPCSETS